MLAALWQRLRAPLVIPAGSPNRAERRALAALARKCPLPAKTGPSDRLGRPKRAGLG